MQGVLRVGLVLGWGVGQKRDGLAGFVAVSDLPRALLVLRRERGVGFLDMVAIVPAGFRVKL